MVVSIANISGPRRVQVIVIPDDGDPGLPQNIGYACYHDAKRQIGGNLGVLVTFAPNNLQKIFHSTSLNLSFAYFEPTTRLVLNDICLPYFYIFIPLVLGSR